MQNFARPKILHYTSAARGICNHGSCTYIRISIMSQTTFRDCRVHFCALSDNLSRSSCNWKQRIRIPCLLRLQFLSTVPVLRPVKLITVSSGMLAHTNTDKPVPARLVAVDVKGHTREACTGSRCTEVRRGSITAPRVALLVKNCLCNRK